MKALVVPEPSERWTTVTGRSGRVAPELSAAIFGSFQFLIVPANRPAIVSASRLIAVASGTL